MTGDQFEVLRLVLMARAERRARRICLFDRDMQLSDGPGAPLCRSVSARIRGAALRPCRLLTYRASQSLRALICGLASALTAFRFVRRGNKQPSAAGACDE